MCLGAYITTTGQRYFYKILREGWGRGECLVSPFTDIPLDYEINEWMKIGFWRSLKLHLSSRLSNVRVELRGLGKLYVWNVYRPDKYDVHKTHWLVESKSKIVTTDRSQSILRKFKVLGQVIDEPRYKNTLKK